MSFKRILAAILRLTTIAAALVMTARAYAVQYHITDWQTMGWGFMSDYVMYNYYPDYGWERRLLMGDQAEGATRPILVLSDDGSFGQIVNLRITFWCRTRSGYVSPSLLGCGVDDPALANFAHMDSVVFHAGLNVSDGFCAGGVTLSPTFSYDRIFETTVVLPIPVAPPGPREDGYLITWQPAGYISFDGLHVHQKAKPAVFGVGYEVEAAVIGIEVIGPPEVGDDESTLFLLGSAVALLSCLAVDFRRRRAWIQPIAQ